VRLVSEVWTYKKAGIDLSKHKLMHERALNAIKELAKKLSINVKDLSGYASSIIYKDREIVLHADGVGTKTLVLQRLNKLEVIGWDCVAMNVNDVVCVGAKPLALLDYIVLPESNEEIFNRVINGVIEASRVSNVAIVGGETAIMSDLVNGVDAACFVMAERLYDIPKRDLNGHVVIGIESWGLHANGYTLLRKIIESKLGSYSMKLEGIDVGEEVSKPTAIYSNLILNALSRGLISSATHITGGAFTKLKRILNSSFDIILKMPEPKPIFKLITKLGNVPPTEMYRVFNMGVGMVVTAPKDCIEEFMNLTSKYGFKSWVLGNIRSGKGKIYIKTFTGDVIEY